MKFDFFRRVFPYLRPYWYLASLSALFTLLGVLAGLLEPWPLQVLVDNVLGEESLPQYLTVILGPISGHTLGMLLFAVATAVGVRLLDNAIKVINSYTQTKLEQNMILDFRSDLFEHAQHLSLAYHDKRRTGQLMYAINNQGNAAAGLLITLLPLIQSSLMLIGMFWVTFRIDRQLALIALMVVPLLYYCVGYYTAHIEPRIKEVMGMEGETLSIVYESMAMMRVVAAFGREKYEFGRFRRQGEDAVDARVRLTVRQTFFSLAVNMIIAVGTAMVMGVGAYQALQERLTVGQLLVILSYVGAVYQPLESISGTIGFLQQRFVALTIAFNLLDTEPEIVDRPNATKIHRCRGRITFEGVYFRYSQRNKTLRNISFEAQAGEVIGIVGPTGAGKSTLVSLIPRFYDPLKGRVLLDGRDLRDIKVRSLRDQISIVLQEPLLFSGTIADNIHYGRLNASRDEIIEAAKAANAHEFISGLPDQYETVIGERGAQLSGGERQRICIARAFLRDAPILILDEPTSAVDSRTEAVILEALERLMKGRTAFMIAHRLSTLRNTDKILVINDGELVEQGTHDELMALNGLYSRFYRIQNGQANGQRQAQGNGQRQAQGNGQRRPIAGDQRQPRGNAPGHRHNAGGNGQKRGAEAFEVRLSRLTDYLVRRKKASQVSRQHGKEGATEAAANGRGRNN